jgi:DnaA family protein
MSGQLPLYISLRDSATFANFLPADNAQLLLQLVDATSLKGERFIYLWGGPGSGKSHLLQAVCHALSASSHTGVYLPLAHTGMRPEMLEGLENMPLIAIDDCQAIAGNRDWETALFNLYNRVRDRGEGHMIVTGSVNPQALGLVLPDFESRLLWGLVFQIQGLNDDQLAQALQMRAKGRGMDMPDDVAGYILRRCPRDMHTLFDLLDKLDHESLVAKRKLTIPFVKKFVE